VLLDFPNYSVLANDAWIIAIGVTFGLLRAWSNE
jgi:hypothetical protein